MIRIARGQEPLDLAKARRKFLARAMLAWARGTSARKATKESTAAPSDTIELTGYKTARHTLYEHAQHRKCAYCEREQGQTNQPVEHFRPKAGALRGDPLNDKIRRNTDEDHYFWLAWTWENLFFSCASCNGRGTKGNWFPLLANTKPLPLPDRKTSLSLPITCFDRNNEHPVLVDPSWEDPLDFIQWTPSNPADSWENLRWEPRGKDPLGRGARTIEVFGLLTDLPQQVSARLRAHLVTKVNKLKAIRQTGDKNAALEVWDEIEKMFAPELPYLAATYNAIEWFLEQPGLTDAASFAGVNLDDLRPGARTIDIPSADIEDPPALASLPDELILGVRAEAWNADDAVLQLCSYRAWEDISELTQALGYNKNTVVRAGNKWVNAGKLARSNHGGFGPPPSTNRMLKKRT